MSVTGARDVSNGDCSTDVDACRKQAGQSLEAEAALELSHLVARTPVTAAATTNGFRQALLTRQLSMLSEHKWESTVPARDLNQSRPLVS
jgi:hypothetical protein